MSRRVDREEQIDRAFALALAKGIVQTFVAVFGRTPNVVFDRAVDIVFGILDRNESGMSDDRGLGKRSARQLRSMLFFASNALDLNVH